MQRTLCSRLRKFRLDLDRWCWGLGLGVWGRGQIKRKGRGRTLARLVCAEKLGLAELRVIPRVQVGGHSLGL